MMITGIFHRIVAGLILAQSLNPASETFSPQPPPSDTPPVVPAAPVAPLPPPPRPSAEPPSSADSQDVGESATFDNLEIADDSLKGKLSVLRVGTGRTDDDILTVFAGVKNLTSHHLALEFQTIYKDKWHNPVTEGKGNWVPITLKPHEEFEYRSVAISQEAVDFLVRIRRAPADDTPE